MRRKILLLLPILAIVLLMCFTLNVKAATVGQIDLIYANPAEDSSTSMRFNWHSKASSCVLHYTVATDTSFANETKVTVKGVANQAKYSDTNDAFNVFKCQIDELTPDTKYIYKITAGSSTSATYGFKTAGYSCSFNFMNYGDLHSTASEHSKISVLDTLIGIAETKTANIGGIDFILSTGDTIEYGDRYSDWQEYNSSSKRKNYMLAQINGNHEQKISTSFSGYSSGQSAVHDWELNTWNNPDNGLNGRCEFWFIYNSVLFIALDDQRGGSVEDAAKWATEVLRRNEGKYQYSVVLKHNPVFRSGDTTWCDWGGYETYSKFCDTYNVDLFLCGDDHEYVRTKQLYNDTVQTNLSKGTVYMTVPMISESTGSLKILNPTDSGAKANNPRYAKSGNSGDTGAIYFTVTPEKLSIYTYQYNGTVVDSYEIKAKRSFRTELKEDIEKSLQYVQLKDANEGIIYADTSITSLVKEISFYNGDTLISKFNPSSSRVSAFNIQGLEANKLINLTAKITYVDNSQKNVNFVANTFDYFGRISNLKVGFVDNKVNLNWIPELVGSSVSTIKVYRNDQQVGEVSPTASSYQFDKTSADEGATYKLSLVSSSGQVIGEYNCVYFGLGDLTYDGAVDANDCDEIAKYVFGGTLTNEQKKFADINGDGDIDFLDASYLWLNHEKGISLSSDTVTVIYKAMDGTIISTQVINVGANAIEPTAPQVDGYTFVAWSASNSSITSDIAIYPIYSK